ncbi:MAG: hypothetical protein IH859_06830 [Chloroflexi bacterium]|nr:hypothetical protein [Chloroflexota bacterium]
MRFYKVQFTLGSFALNAKVILGWLILALLLNGCSGILYSSLDKDEIRATAQDIATTRLATTVEVIILPTLTLGPDIPTATVDPTFCPQDELTIWKEIALADIELLDSEIQILNSESYSAEQLNEIHLRAQSQAGSLPQSSFPRCAMKAVRRLANVYLQFVITMEVMQGDDRANLSLERTTLLEERTRLFQELRRLLSDKEFRELKAAISNNGE